MANLVNPLLKDVFFVATGTFDGDVDRVAPDDEYYCKRRQPWLVKSPGSNEYENMQ